MNEITESSKINYQETKYTDFDELLYSYHDGKLLKGIYAYGFERPSPVQELAIKPILDGSDVIAQAQSGTGKTGAFTISSLAILDIDEKYPQILILSNTRELSTQIHTVINKIGNFINPSTILCIGGKNTDTKNIIHLNDVKKSQIIVGTPGKIVSLIDEDDRKNSKNNKYNLFDRLKLIIFDEADSLLSDNFVSQTHAIVSKIPVSTQVCLFSATFPENVLRITEQITKDPIKLLIKKENVSVDLIKNYCVFLELQKNRSYNMVDSIKIECITDFYKQINICQAIIFVNTIDKAKFLSDRLTKLGHSVGVIHGALTTEERIETMRVFRLTHTRILVATDIIARGIDIQQVGLVINYDVPLDPEQYIHRVGRSGRYGKLGVAITFITDIENKRSTSDYEKIGIIEDTYKIKFKDLPNLCEVSEYLSGTQKRN